MSVATGGGVRVNVKWTIKFMYILIPILFAIIVPATLFLTWYSDNVLSSEIRSFLRDIQEKNTEIGQCSAEELLPVLKEEYKTVISDVKNTLADLKEVEAALLQRGQQRVNEDALMLKEAKLSVAEQKEAWEELLRNVEHNVEPKYWAQCMDIITGNSSMAQSHQDWILFHTYFKERAWGDGFYLDLGASNPFHISNTLFFDKCLGWKGICVEPSPEYHHYFKDRSCTLYKNCLYKEEKYLELTLEGMLGQLVEPGGDNKKKSIPVKCRTLDSILDEENIKKVDFASLDIEGQEAGVLQCFNFENYDIQLWMIETNKQGKYFDYLMNRGGYNLVSQIFQGSDKTDARCGYELDTLYEKRLRTLKLPQPMNPNYRICLNEGDQLGVKAPRCSQRGLPLSIQA